MTCPEQPLPRGVGIAWTNVDMGGGVLPSMSMSGVASNENFRGVVPRMMVLETPMPRGSVNLSSLLASCLYDQVGCI
jgi:hypothetical protein